jgi:hypothetical protein
LEGLLNSVWVLLAATAIGWRFLRLRQCSGGVPVLLVCIAALLFPAVSMTDDLRFQLAGRSPPR